MVSSNANGTNISYTWDADNRLSTVTDNRNGETTTYSMMHRIHIVPLIAGGEQTTLCVKCRAYQLDQRISITNPSPDNRGSPIGAWRHVRGRQLTKSEAVSVSQRTCAELGPIWPSEAAVGQCRRVPENWKPGVIPPIRASRGGKQSTNSQR